MKRAYNNQTGFGAVGIVVIIVALLGVGGSGYAVYKAHHKTSKATTSSSTANASKTSTSSTTKSSGTTGTSTATQTATNYFTILQWDVRAPVSYSGTDLTASPVSGYSNEMWLNSQALASHGGSGCAIISSAGNLGYIGKYLPTDTIPGIPPQPTAQQYASEHPVSSGSSTGLSYAEVGGYYYIYWPPQNGCATSSSLQNQEQATAGTAVDNLQAVSN